MLSAGSWNKNQQNTVLFVLTDSAGLEVTGLGSGYTLRLSKAGAAFAVSAGTKSEISLGWYKYVSTAGEADTSGPIAIVVTHASIVQQNLEYYVGSRVVASIEFTYTVTSSVGGLPIENVYVLFATDPAFVNTIWDGYTDVFGVARDGDGNKPMLTAGTYYIRLRKNGYNFSDDSEVVS